ncbi:Holliday junction branch migration protein RuvA [bacterium]|jgi:holliday junction DNA helicase RuvA|nr:Holliday junction branch migration protein RuvA [bacterium]MDP4617002.1 Holliday junction branch migration protein RuvA [Schleiferiaceae bacterium]MDP4758570.1 Holliday junction branch migration protein RuvA [Schleiferiaceae bacterium]MDP4767473.1 Holliday junction branch migration protein RuvA [Schleiferiaceae bacterium]MDP4958681.1 Holliday junction branch migration protein RuvA [Schleiferiaceae bacterium]
MIYYVKGAFVLKTATQVVVDCAGVGYDVQISLNTYADVEPLSEGLLYTYHLVREDAQMLFGFSTQREKALFELLISVSGVGANTARVILSSLSPTEVEQAILSEDVPTLQGVKGIGAKTAQRIVIDLKDKVVKTSAGLDAGGPVARSGARAEAHAALTTLGISAKQAETVLNKLLKQNPGAPTEELVRQALQML